MTSRKRSSKAGACRASAGWISRLSWSWIKRARMAGASAEPCGAGRLSQTRKKRSTCPPAILCASRIDSLRTLFSENGRSPATRGPDSMASRCSRTRQAPGLSRASRTSSASWARPARSAPACGSTAALAARTVPAGAAFVRARSCQGPTAAAWTAPYRSGTRRQPRPAAGIRAGAGRGCRRSRARLLPPPTDRVGPNPAGTLPTE